jgi:DNA-directed RNA polymerase specialized sigma24 family protein
MGSRAAGPGDSAPAFADDLLGLMEDAQIRHLALRRAGNRDLAEDALQSAYCAVARIGHPENIRDLRSYFAHVLVNEVNRLHGQLGATLMEDFTSMADAHQQADTAPPVPRPIDEMVSTHLLAEAWLEPFATRRRELADRVPGRSSDPRRYRDVIVADAEQVLCDAIDGGTGQADSNDAFRAAYPEYFDQPGASPNTLHQRFSRAREDVRVLLQAVVSRDELRL